MFDKFQMNYIDKTKLNIELLVDHTVRENRPLGIVPEEVGLFNLSIINMQDDIFLLCARLSILHGDLKPIPGNDKDCEKAASGKKKKHYYKGSYAGENYWWNHWKTLPRDDGTIFFVLKGNLFSQDYVVYNAIEPFYLDAEVDLRLIKIENNVYYYNRYLTKLVKLKVELYNSTKMFRVTKAKSYFIKRNEGVADVLNSPIYSINLTEGIIANVTYLDWFYKSGLETAVAINYNCVVVLGTQSYVNMCYGIFSKLSAKSVSEKIEKVEKQKSTKASSPQKLQRKLIGYYNKIFKLLNFLYPNILGNYTYDDQQQDSYTYEYIVHVSLNIDDDPLYIWNVIYDLYQKFIFIEHYSYYLGLGDVENEDLVFVKNDVEHLNLLIIKLLENQQIDERDAVAYFRKLGKALEYLVVDDDIILDVNRENTYYLISYNVGEGLIGDTCNDIETSVGYSELTEETDSEPSTVSEPSDEQTQPQPQTICSYLLFSFSTPLIDVVYQNTFYKLGVGHSKIHSDSYSTYSTDDLSDIFRDRLYKILESKYGNKYKAHFGSNDRSSEKPDEPCKGYMYLLYFYLIDPQNDKCWISNSYLPFAPNSNEYVFSLCFPTGLTLGPLEAGGTGDVYVSCGDGDFYSYVLKFDLAKIYSMCVHDISKFNPKEYQCRILVSGAPKPDMNIDEFEYYLNNIQEAPLKR